MRTVASSSNYELSFDEENRILLMKFIGDISDEVYKGFWNKAIDYAVEHQINRVIIDQSSIGNVSFNARGWVVINAFPRVKKQLPKNMAVGVLSSGRIVQKAGMQYLLKSSVMFTAYQVQVFPTIEECISFLASANELSANEPRGSKVA